MSGSLVVYTKDVSDRNEGTAALTRNKFVHTRIDASNLVPIFLVNLVLLDVDQRVSKLGPLVLEIKVKPRGEGSERQLSSRIMT